MPLSRRSLLKLGGVLLAGAVIPRQQRQDAQDWPIGVPLGRVTESRIRLYSRPRPDGNVVAFKYRDDVVVVVRAVVGLGFYPHNHLWFETPEGYAYSSWVQPVRNAPNGAAAAILPEGIYVEVSVPFTDAHARPDPQSPILYRLYYSTVYQASGVATAPDGSAWYRLNDENVVAMYAPAQACRPVAPEEFAPLAAGVNDKRILVSLGQQTLAAYEGQTEVFRAPIASGRDYFGPDGTTLGSLTPAGEHPLWSKRASRHMTGGTPQNGYDLPGVPWVMYFSANGAALHGTYWHNDFGTPKSAGCINLRPTDAKWLFRWTLPAVPYVPGYVTVEWPGGTRVVIQD